MLSPIVIVEDNVNDIELISIATRRSRLANEIVFLRDGQEAIDYLECRSCSTDRVGGYPAVILLDIKLPKLNGLEVLEHIKSSEKLKRTPVVMLTSSRESQDVTRSYELGANGYIVKPVRFDDLVQALGRIGFFWAVLNEPPPGTSTSRDAASELNLIDVINQYYSR